MIHRQNFREFDMKSCVCENSQTELIENNRHSAVRFPLRNVIKTFFCKIAKQTCGKLEILSDIIMRTLQK